MKNVKVQFVKPEKFRVYRVIQESEIPKDFPKHWLKQLKRGRRKLRSIKTASSLRRAFKRVDNTNLERKSADEIFYVTRVVVEDRCYYEKITHTTPSFSSVGPYSERWTLKGNFNGAVYTFEQYQELLLTQGWRMIELKKVKEPRRPPLPASLIPQIPLSAKTTKTLEWNNRILDEFFSESPAIEQEPEPPQEPKEPSTTAAAIILNRKIAYNNDPTTSGVYVEPKFKKFWRAHPAQSINRELTPEEKFQRLSIEEKKAFIRSKLSKKLQDQYDENQAIIAELRKPSLPSGSKEITLAPEERNMSIKEIVKYRLSLKEKGKTKNE